jgi:hypothetical protein
MSRIRKPSRRLLLVFVAALALTLVAATAVVAVAVKKNGGSVTAVRTATDSEPTSTIATSWFDVAGMSTTVNVPAGQKALLVISFSGETLCQDFDGTTLVCQIRVTVDGVNAEPGEVVFDSQQANSGWSTNSMQFVRGSVNAGQRVVKVQFRVNESPAEFHIGDRTLTVLRSKV